MKKIDINSLVKKASLFERLATYGNRRSFLEALSQDKGETIGFTPEQLEMMNPTRQPTSFQRGDGPVEFPETSNQGATHPWQGGAPPVKQKDPKVVQLQTMLNSQHLTGADGKPLVVDGIIGKNTRFAIESFKQENNMPGASEAVAIDFILNPKDNRQSSYSGNNNPNKLV
jgi:hypothetical protein